MSRGQWIYVIFLLILAAVVFSWDGYVVATNW